MNQGGGSYGGAPMAPSPISAVVAWQPCACCGLGGQLLAGEVVLEPGEEVPDNRHAPGLAQDLLSLLAVHVLHVRVVLGEAKDSGVGGERQLVQLVERSSWWWRA